MVIAYLRVSTVHQHLDNQRGEITHYAKRNGIKIDKWITDTISGSTDKSKRNLGKILKQMHGGDVLIVTEISRLSRTLLEVMNIMKYCVDNNIAIYSTKDGYTFDDSINSKVLSFAFGLAAEIEHKLISLRTKEALAVIKEKGGKIGRRKGSGDKIKILNEHKDEVEQDLASGMKIIDICNKYGVSYKTYYRFKKKSASSK